MPRHKRAAGPASKRVVRRMCKVRRVPVQSAELIEIGPDHSAWQVEDFEGVCDGAIVKLVPPPGTAESLVLHMERSMYSGGAVSVQVMPTQEEVKVTVEGETFDFTESDDERPLRQVVMERAQRVTSSYDQDALEALLTKAMDHAEATT